MDSFDDGFAPIKTMSSDDAKGDKFISRLKRVQKDVKQKKTEKLRRLARDFMNNTILRDVSDEDEDGDQTQGNESVEVSASFGESSPAQMHSQAQNSSLPFQDPKLTQNPQLTSTQTQNTSKIQDPNPSKPSQTDVSTVKSAIRSQLTTRPRISMDVPQTELYALMENTVRDHEGNSTLVIGPRGSGKTVLISQCLAQLEANYHGEYLVIRLNSFIHADDDSALREIAAQFARGLRSQGVESGPIETRQLTTTFSNILRILDNPDADDTMSIIFVIDDLETFTSGNKQILLYNLFELTQSSRTPICIIGTSTKFTTRELLEKRVRSRFSQRLVVINKFSQFDQFCQNCLNNLRLDQDQISTLENPQYGRQWNSHIDALASTDSCLRRVLSLNFNTSRNIKMFNNSAMLPVSQISTTSPYPLDSQFMGLIHNQIKNPIEAMFNALSPLELLLVVAAARFIEKSSLVTVNFNIAYQEYADMMKQYNIDKSIVRSSSVTTHNIPTNLKVNVKVWDPTVLKNCWMSLYRHGLLIDYTPNTAEGGKFTATSNRSFVLEDSRMLQLDLTLAEIGQLLPDDNGFRALTRL